MSDVHLAFGQRLLPAATGEQHLATAYAAIGQRQIACLADGTVGTLPLRLAAQIATSTALSRLRTAVLGERQAQLADALIDAHDAVRRGLAGSPQEGASGASLMVAVIDCDAGGRTVLARVGHGRAYIIDAHSARPVFRDAPTAVGLGFTVDIPEASWANLILQPGERLVLMSESAHSVLAADLARIAHQHGAQLTAQRLAETAHRRGQHDAIGIATFERLDTGPRDGHHPAFARMDRDRPLTFDEDGRLLGAQFIERQRGGSDRKAGPVGWLAWFGLAALLGGLTALLTLPEVPVEAEAPPIEVAAPAPPEAARPAPSPSPPPPPEPSAPALHPEVVEALAAPSAGRMTRLLRNFITRHYPELKEGVFEALEAALLHHAAEGTLPPAAIEALVTLARDQRLKRTASWATEFLPRLLPTQDESP